MDNENVEVVQLYLDDIIPNRFQPREVFDDQALKELAVSIREHGVIQPIIVRKFGEKYEIIAGERRYKASTMAGLTKIPAIVRNLDDKESSKVALIENLQRRDLTPIEEARTYQKILDLDTMTQDQLAKTMGKSQSAVSNKLRLLTLPDEVQEALLNNKISERHARSLLNVADKNTQINLLKEIIANKMTVRELDQKIRDLNGTDTTSGGTANNMNNMGVNNMNYVDPTAVDINRIREQATDINAPVQQPVANNNIDLMGNGNMPTNNGMAPTENRFVPVTTDTGIEKTEDGNEVIGNGLLAGMPVIKPVDEPMGEGNILPTVEVAQAPATPNFDSLFAAPATNAAPVENPMPSVEPAPTQEPVGIDSLFSTPAPEQKPINNELPAMPTVTAPQSQDLFGAPMGGNYGGYNGSVDLSDLQFKPLEDQKQREAAAQAQAQVQQPTPQPDPSGVNSLFASPTQPVEQPVTTEQPMNPSGLFGDPVAAQQPTQVVATINVEEGTAQVKNLIQTLQSQGYNVTVEELNLDREVQLIIKFIKG